MDRQCEDMTLSQIKSELDWRLYDLEKFLSRIPIGGAKAKQRLVDEMRELILLIGSQNK